MVGAREHRISSRRVDHALMRHGTDDAVFTCLAGEPLGEMRGVRSISPQRFVSVHSYEITLNNFSGEVMREAEELSGEEAAEFLAVILAANVTGTKGKRRPTKPLSSHLHGPLQQPADEHACRQQGAGNVKGKIQAARHVLDVTGRFY